MSIRINKVRRTDYRPPSAGQTPALERSARPGVEPAQITQRKCKVCRQLFTPPKYSQRACCSTLCANKLKNIDRIKNEYWWVNSKGYYEGCVWENGIRRRVRQHRWIMENHLGRKLTPFEHIHHIDGNRLNNDLTNLELTDCVTHAFLHNRERQQLSGKVSPKSTRDRIKRRSIERAIKRGRITP